MVPVLLLEVPVDVEDQVDGRARRLAHESVQRAAGIELDGPRGQPDLRGRRLDERELRALCFLWRQCELLGFELSL